MNNLGVSYNLVNLQEFQVFNRFTSFDNNIQPSNAMDREDRVNKYKIFI